VKTKLDKLIESIDPAITLDRISAFVDKAINSFPEKRGAVTQWEKFKEFLARFHCHIDNVVIQYDIPREFHYGFDWSRCYHLLEAEYGKNGYKRAFDMSRTGLEGGLYGVLKAVANQMIHFYAGNETSVKISHFLNPLSVDERFEIMDEYLDKYGHLLPSELTEGYAGRIKVNFFQVLKQHPHLVKKMRRVGREF